jgi:hypothetical protein
VTYKIKNWHQFQHFKDRKPPWIKLYRDLLDDVDWHDLDPKAAKNLVMIWLVASEYDGELPDMKTLAFRLRVPENEAKSIVSKLSHWLVQTDISVISERYQVDSLEIETETEKEKETEREVKGKRETKRATRLPDTWHPRAEDGLDNLELAKFRDYWRAVPGQKGTKLDWDATWRNWLRTAGKSPTNAKPSVEVRTGPRNVFKPEPETPQLTEEEKARRREQVDAVLKGLWKPSEPVSQGRS